MIHGVGIDIVNVARFKAAMERWGTRFTHRLFTDDELSYCMSRKRPEMHLAARFAAKEAFFKAMGGPLSFTDIEVLRDDNGRPELRVKGFDEGYRYFLTMTHEKDNALSQVIVEKP